MALNIFKKSTDNTELSTTPAKQYTGGTWVAKNDYDVEWIAKRVSARWLLEEPNGYVMKNKSAQKLQEISTMYSSMLRQLSDTDGGSKSNTQRKSDLNKEITAALHILLNYMLEKTFPSTDLSPYLNDLGFASQGSGFKYPEAEIERLKALGKTIEGIKRYKLEDKPFGLSYWQGVRDEYDALVTGRHTRTGEKRVTAAEKNAKKDELNKYLLAVRRMLWSEHDQSEKATHAVWVDWGFKYFY